MSPKAEKESSSSQQQQQQQHSSRGVDMTLLTEERSKRLRAETALQHQKTMVTELQTQLATIQEREQRNATIKESIDHAHHLDLSSVLNRD